jgi:murein DD-endopeptidase MepM/ murein hydrolase activator NlpD
MSIYKQKRKRSKKERVGFYTALSICIIAVGMAAYSTYTTYSGYLEKSQKSTVAPVNQVVTGVTETEAPVTTEEPTYETVETTEEPTEIATESETKTALQTMLTVNTSLSYPLDSAKVLQEYSEESVYNKTLNQWQAHTGVDFQCQVGDNVYSMGDGEVTKIFNDDLLGKTVVVKSATYTAYYSGLGDNVKTSKGESIKVGDIIGVAGSVPSEAMDDSHVHIAVKVGNQYVDPLTLINNDE